MANALTWWRKKNNRTARCRILGEGDTHPASRHRGDLVDALPASTLATTSDEQRTTFAPVIITDIPEAIAQKAQRWLLKGKWVNDDPEEGEERPRILNVDVDLLKAEYPAQAANIDKLFEVGRTLTIAQVPSFTWAKFRNCVWDKINLRVVPEAQWETDPDG